MTENWARGCSQKERGIAKQKIEEDCALVCAHEIHPAKKMTSNANG